MKTLLTLLLLPIIAQGANMAKAKTVPTNSIQNATEYVVAIEYGNDTVSEISATTDSTMATSQNAQRSDGGIVARQDPYHDETRKTANESNSPIRSRIRPRSDLTMEGNADNLSRVGDSARDIGSIPVPDSQPEVRRNSRNARTSTIRSRQNTSAQSQTFDNTGLGTLNNLNTDNSNSLNSGNQGMTQNDNLRNRNRNRVNTQDRNGKLNELNNEFARMFEIAEELDAARRERLAMRLEFEALRQEYIARIREIYSEGNANSTQNINNISLRDNNAKINSISNLDNNNARNNNSSLNNGLNNTDIRNNNSSSFNNNLNNIDNRNTDSFINNRNSVNNSNVNKGAGSIANINGMEGLTQNNSLRANAGSQTGSNMRARLNNRMGTSMNNFRGNSGLMNGNGRNGIYDSGNMQNFYGLNNMGSYGNNGGYFGGQQLDNDRMYYLYDAGNYNSQSMNSGLGFNNSGMGYSNRNNYRNNNSQNSGAFGGINGSDYFGNDYYRNDMFDNKNRLDNRFIHQNYFNNGQFNMNNDNENYLRYPSLMSYDMNNGYYGYQNNGNYGYQGNNGFGNNMFNQNQFGNMRSPYSNYDSMNNSSANMNGYFGANTNRNMNRNTNGFLGGSNIAMGNQIAY